MHFPSVTFLILLAAALGGLTPIIIKDGLREITPISFTLLRFLIAALVLIPACAGSLKTMLHKPGLKTLLLASLGNVANVILFAFGVRFISPSLAQLLYLLGPVLTYCLSMSLLSETPSLRRTSGVLLGLSGATLAVVSGPDFSLNLNSRGNLGIGLILLAVLSHVSYTVISKKVKLHFSPQEQTLLMSALCILTLLVLLPFEPESLLTSASKLSQRAWLAVIYSGAVATGLYYFLMQAVIRKASPVSAASILYVQIGFTFSWAALLYGERLHWLVFLGAAIAIAGAFMVSAPAPLQAKGK